MNEQNKKLSFWRKTWSMDSDYRSCYRNDYCGHIK